MIEQILRISNNIVISNQLNGNQESWYLEDLDQDSILLHQVEHDQSQSLDKLSLNFEDLNFYGIVSFPALQVIIEALLASYLVQIFLL